MPTWLILFTALTFNKSHYVGATKFKLTCLNTDLHLQCYDHERIIIEGAAFGHFKIMDHALNESAGCKYFSGKTCWIDKNYLFANLCTGRSNCIYSLHYSHEIQEEKLRQKCGDHLLHGAELPLLFIQYRCISSAMITSLSIGMQFDAEHVGGYIATPDYLNSIETPDSKNYLAEDVCRRWKLPAVYSIPAPFMVKDDPVGLILRVRDAGSLFSNHKRVQPSNGKKLNGSRPVYSALEPCLGDYLRVDINTRNRQGYAHDQHFVIEICPHCNEEASSNSSFRRFSFHEDNDFEEGLAFHEIGPIYDFHSLDFLVNMNLIPSISEGWVKGILLEYILLYCTRLPEVIGGGRIAYRFEFNRNTGRTLAVVEAVCPEGRYFYPSADDSGQLFSNLTLVCDHYRREWSQVLPEKCLSESEISSIPSIPIHEYQHGITDHPSAQLNDSSSNSDPPLSHGSFAVVGGVFGFLLCILVILLVFLALRKKLMRLIWKKFSITSLPKSFRQSGTILNTLSGSLSVPGLSRTRKASKWRHNHLSRSVATIGDKFDSIGSLATSLRRYRNRSRASLHTNGHPSDTPIATNRRKIWQLDENYLHTDTSSQGELLLGATLKSTTQYLQGREAECKRAKAISKLNQNTVFVWSQSANGIYSSDASDRNLLSSIGGEFAPSLLSTDFNSSDIRNYGFPHSNHSTGQTLKSNSTKITTIGEQPISNEERCPTQIVSDSNEIDPSDSLPWRTTQPRNISSGLRRLSSFFRSVGSSFSSASFPRKDRIDELEFHTSTTNAIDGILSPSRLEFRNNSSDTLQADDPVQRRCTDDNPSYFEVYNVDYNQNLHESNIQNTFMELPSQKSSNGRMPVSPLRWPSQTIKAHLPLHASTDILDEIIDSFEHPVNKGDTLNAETYLEPYSNIEVQGISRNDSDVFYDDRMEDFVSDNDTSQQQTWPSGASDVDERGMIPEASNPLHDSANPQSATNGSTEADYFTYDGADSRPREHFVIRRPRLKIAGTSSRPLSDAMMSNHYYDDNELLPFPQLEAAAGAQRASIYSNDSHYELIDRTKQKNRKFDGSIPQTVLRYPSDTAMHDETKELISTDQSLHKQLEGRSYAPYANIDEL